MVKNETGAGKIQIRFNEEGSYLWVNRPIALSWSDHNGSVGKYLCLFPWSKEYRDIIFNEIQENLYLNYSNIHTKLVDDFKWLFKLLSSGNYYINFVQQKKVSLAFNQSLYNSSEIVFKEHKRIQHLIPNMNRTYTNEGYYDGFMDQIGGYPVPIQQGVDLDWAASTISNLEERYEKSLSLGKNYVNLFSFSLMYNFEKIGDSTCYFGITKENLKQLKFDETILILQDT